MAARLAQVALEPPCLPTSATGLSHCRYGELPVCIASVRAAAGMGLNGMPLGKDSSAQGRAAMKMSASVKPCSAIRSQCSRCSRHTSARFPCQRAPCQDEAQTCLARVQEITTSPPERTADVAVQFSYNCCLHRITLQTGPLQEASVSPLSPSCSAPRARTALPTGKAPVWQLFALE